MTTAIVVSNSDGIVGRCDAKCHNASSPDCDCICGGRLHGSGARAIEQNTRDWLGDDWREKLEKFAELHGLDPATLTVESVFEQKSLFEGGGS